MEYTIDNQGPYTVIALVGEVDLAQSPKAREQILKYLSQQQPVVVDLKDVTWIDSSGVASLVEGYQFALTKQLQFGLVSVSRPAMQVLHLARLDKVIPIHESMNDLLALKP